MPTKKKTVTKKETIKSKKTTAKSVHSRAKGQKLSPKAYFQAIKNNVVENKKLYTRYALTTLAVIVLGAFLFVKKDWFVAAVINNQPVTTVEYYQNLKAKDNKQVLNQLVRDKLITQEANKKGILISQKDLEAKIQAIEKQLGGNEGLQQALESRGIKEAEFKNQIRIQLIVEKLLADQIKVSDKEVEDYIAKNKDSTVLGVDINDKKAVKEQLENEKLNEKFQPWYEELQKNAKIYLFI